MPKYTYALAACSMLLCIAERARAYCRESVDAPDVGACVQDPSAKYVYWTRSCTSYVFNELVFQRVSSPPPSEDSETFVRRAFRASFQAWADVPCDGRKPFYVEQSPGVTQTDRSEFVLGKVNESVITLRTPQQWAQMPDHDPRAVALTLVWFLKRTGEITDFDMELNGGAGDFADCVEQRCSLGMIDLQNTVTHEAGHVLGLAHSSAPGATMQPSTTIGPETTKRVLKTDDKLGYCALDLPQFVCDSPPCMCPAPPVYGSSNKGCGCQLARGASPAGAAAWVMLLLAGWWVWRVQLRASR